MDRFACRVRRGWFPIGVAGFLCAALAPAAEVRYRTVAVIGDDAPGFDPPARFAAFTTPLNHNFMAPRIDEQGNVAFIALVAPGVAGARSGIWMERDGVLTLVVRTGTHAPGTPPGVLFSGVPSEYLPLPPSVRGGRAAFGGELVGPGVTFTNMFGAWAEGPAGIRLLARGDEPAAGLPAGVLYGDVFQPVLVAGGRVVVFGTLRGNAVTDDNNEAVWSDRSGALELLLREGDAAPDLAGLVIGRGVFAHPRAFGGSAISTTGRVALQANLSGPGVTAFNDEAIFYEEPQTGAWTLLVREDGDAPGFPAGSDFGGGSVTAQFTIYAFNALGHIAFSGRVGGAGGTNLVLFTNHRGPLAPAVIPGQPAPGTSSTFGLFGPPALNDVGQLAFRASLMSDEDGDPFTLTPLGVFWDRHGAVEPVVLPGAPTADGSTIGGIDFIAGFTDSGWLGLAGTLNDPVRGLKYGLHLVSPAGELHQLVSTGDLFDVRGDGTELRQVIRIVHGGVSEAGEFAFRLDFADNTSGYFTARVVDGRIGDANCDANVDFFDIDPFLLALFDPAGYRAAFCGGNLSNVDVNGDNHVDFFDIDPFLQCLFAACP